MSTRKLLLKYDNFYVLLSNLLLEAITRELIDKSPGNNLLLEVRNINLKVMDKKYTTHRTKNIISFKTFCKENGNE